MLNKPTNDIKDESVKNHIEFLNQEAQGKIIELSDTPTSTVPLLEAGEWGVYSNVLYHRVGNTILVFTPGSTITVT
jgi:hypothetical protein